MKVQMRSNDIFYGLTFDAPFFAFVHQHMFLWLKETYPSLELGTYAHFADNIHYYERHFELASQILENGPTEKQYTMNIIEPLFTVNGGLNYTEHGKNFIKIIDTIAEDTKQTEYLAILKTFLNIK